MDLFARSIEIILDHQHRSGAYVASPTFATYHYCWFRDASYIAYAMDRAGQPESAARYHAWAARTILAHRAAVQRGLEKLAEGRPPDTGEYIHTRYHLDGAVETDGEWPNFQLDGVGTWLWGLAEHLRLNGCRLDAQQGQAVELCVDYLNALWDRPCYDCWEERPEQLHTYTLSALYRGLKSFRDVRPDTPRVLSGIRRVVQARAVLNGCLIKDLDGADEVDGNLLAVAVPNDLIAPDDPVMQATVARIERELCTGDGGVHRYVTDSYYGGGEWVLLTAWLGWYYAAVGQLDRARRWCAWVEAQADAHGQLPEQVAAHLNRPESLEPWRQRWGESARPLLWSHAAYLILRRAIDQPGP